MNALREHRSLSLQDLLAVEDDEAVPRLRCVETGLPLWPQIRTVFLRMIMSDLLYGREVTGRAATEAPRWKAVLALGRYAAHNAGMRLSGRLPAPVCIFGDGVADQQVDGRWYNRLVDHFVGVKPRETIVVADHFDWRWPYPRQHERLFMHAPLQATLSVFGRARRGRRHGAARDFVHFVAERARSILGWTAGAAREERLTDMLAAKWAALPLQFAFYERLLCKVRPRVLLVGGACYGPASALIAAARQRRVTTAEYQHGAISAGHDAYNFAPAVLVDARYRQTLPEVFLGYGSWWNEQINAPVTKLSIGYPHRAALLAKLQAQAVSDGSRREPSNLLLLSDGIEFDLYLQLALAVRQAAVRAGLRVCLRPHPLERGLVAALPATAFSGIDIDTEPDLYRSLERAAILVSEVSTGLFEAVGLVPRILLWDTPKARFGYPVHPFESFRDASELQALLEQGVEARGVRLPRQAIWADGWEANYRGFLAAHGVA